MFQEPPAMSDQRDDVNLERFRAVMEAISVLRSEMNRGFDGVHRRQDITNGRVQALEVDGGRYDERIGNLEAIEQVRHHATSKAMEAARLQPATVEQTAEAKPITRREVAIFAGATTSAITFMYWVLKFLGRLVP
jgi:hypothetical protein